VATYYVDSNAGGAGTGADWTNAFTTLTAAYSGKAAGDVFYVAQDHAESTASAVTLTPPGTAAAPSRTICVNKAGTVPPVSADLRTTATVSTTGANNLTIAGTVNYFEGIAFQAGSGAVNASLLVMTGGGIGVFKNCALRQISTNSVSGGISIGIQNGASLVRMENTSIEPGNTSTITQFRGRLIWRDTPSAVTTRLANINFGAARTITIEGCDFSGFASVFSTDSGPGTIVFRNCKLHASNTFTATSAAFGLFHLVNCDSGDTNYRTESHQYGASLTTETTTVRTGGASDGTTTIAWKIDPNANNDRDIPFECFPISIWNETVGSVTVTIEGTWAGGAVPTTADIWMDVEYLGTSGFPLSTFAEGLADSLAAGTNHTASSETWGAGGTTKFKMAQTFTTAEKGPITCWIKYANVTNNVWIDPKITVS
jgi:hypothetical protein